MSRLGHQFLYWEQMASKFSEHTNGDGYSNIGYPAFTFRKRGKPFVDFAIVLGNYKDAKRIAETHTKKGEVYQTSFLCDGVLGTNDHEKWQFQRRQLSESFLLTSNMNRIFKISWKRAKFSVLERLPIEGEIDMNEFFLYEAMAQLQLALLGEDEEFMDSGNKHIRHMFTASFLPRNKSFSGEYEVSKDDNVFKLIQRKTHALRKIKAFTNEVYERGVTNEHPGPVMENIIEMSRDTDSVSGKCPFSSKDIDTMRRDSINTFLFAGHDTTANLMTHFVYELSLKHNEKWLRKVQEEVDNLFLKLSREKRDLEYSDLVDLNVLKRCINETLRLWPSVPNGTFRQFEFDDFIQGYNNKPAKVPKGTQCVVPVWLLHRNPMLWKEPNVYNPDRDWLPEEDWHGKGLTGLNPASHRFCPFTFKPRDCMGRNFAQMEARVILICFLRMFNFKIGDKSKDKHLLQMTGNFGTLGSKKGIFIKLSRRRDNLYE